jgi:hypothetical protein
MGVKGFGSVHSLGYLVVETTDLDRWRELAVDVLGMAVGTGPDESALYLRLDDRPYRLVVHPGQTERLVTVGWDGLRVSEEGYTAEDITADSVWGHRWAWQKQ